jgi:phosphate-selective porin OprO/OprP
MRAPTVLLLTTTLASSAVFAADSDTERRLQALESRILQLEQENKALNDRVNADNKRAAQTVRADVAPTIGDPEGNFTFKPRGLINTDAVFFDERAGGYNFNSGTAVRKFRLGFDGTAFKHWAWRAEAEFAGNAVSLFDAYVAYTGVPSWTFTAGQSKVPFDLEFNTNSAWVTFIERGMANTAIGNLVGERRIGVVAAYSKGAFTWSGAVTGDNEAGVRADTAPYESAGFNTRGTWTVLQDTKAQQIVQLGAAAAWRTHLKQPSGATTISNAIRLSDRPNVRVDNGNLADTGVIPNVDEVMYLGAEFVGVHKSFSLQGEYNRLHAYRNVAGLPGLDFDGGYVFASWFPTGESRTLRNGLIDRLRPLRNFSPGEGGWGALELLLRYDWFDFSDTPVVARRGNKGHSLTSGFTWYYNPNIKFMFNWVRFAGTNTPLDPVGNRTEGDAFAARAHVDF